MREVPPACLRLLHTDGKCCVGVGAGAIQSKYPSLGGCKQTVRADASRRRKRRGVVVQSKAALLLVRVAAAAALIVVGHGCVYAHAAAPTTADAFRVVQTSVHRIPRIRQPQLQHVPTGSRVRGGSWPRRSTTAGGAAFVANSNGNGGTCFGDPAAFLWRKKNKSSGKHGVATEVAQRVSSSRKNLAGSIIGQHNTRGGGHSVQHSAQLCGVSSEATAAAADCTPSRTSTSKAKAKQSNIGASSSSTSAIRSNESSNSVHLRLGSSAMTAKVEDAHVSNVESPTENSVTCDDDEEVGGNDGTKKEPRNTAAANLHTYHDPTTNFSVSGLSVPLSKFGLFVNHTIHASSLAASAAADVAAAAEDDASRDAQTQTQTQTDVAPPNLKFDQAYLSTEEVYVDDDATRDRLRSLWRNRQLISDRTEFLAVYRSDKKVLEEEGGRKKEEGEEGSKERPTQKKKKRGDFTDLLNIYADRLVGIIKDEREEEEASAEIKQRMVDNEEAKLLQNMTEATEMESQLTDGVAGGLVGYLKREYGERETEELMARSLLMRPQEEQFKVLQHFLDWFRSRFPYYYDRCDSCGASAKDEPPPAPPMTEAAGSDDGIDIAATDGDDSIQDEQDDDDDDDGSNFIGYVHPSERELRGKAGRTEVYRCHSCGSFTRFPRYNSACTVIRNRRGRCGEYSMLMFRILRAAGHDARWVVDWADHVWAEVLLGQPARWIHLDPCEAAIDNNLLYQDWGKQQTYIVAFHAPRRNGIIAVHDGKEGATLLNPRKTPLIEDVTHKYTSDGIANITKRRDEPRELVELSLLETESELRLKLDQVVQEQSQP